MIGLLEEPIVYIVTWLIALDAYRMAVQKRRNYKLM
jgi:hypothetical protein